MRSPRPSRCCADLRMAKRLLIVGAGEAGRMLAREVPTASARPVPRGRLSRRRARARGQSVDGFPVLGSHQRTRRRSCARERVDEVLIAVPSAGREFVRRMVALCRDSGVAYRIVPGLLEIIKGPVHLEQIRDVRPEDLLGRETVEFDDAEMARFLDGRTVLVTGAGGSIGGEICRQVARFDVKRLVLLGPRRESDLRDRARAARALSDTRRRPRHRRRARRGCVDARVRAVPARDRVPRRGPQARPLHGGVSRRSGEEQHPRHAQRDRRRLRGRGRRAS